MANDALRPKDWSNYIGQSKLKHRLKLHISAALDRYEMLDHTLLIGPAGCGKTSVAQLISQEMGSDFLSFVMPIKPKILNKALTGFSGLLFLDEIHRMSKKDQESLLPVLEDGYVQQENGVQLPLNNVTIVGATTEPEKIITPLFDRFVIKPPFEDYSDEEMARILKGMANRVGLYPTDEEAMALGIASAGVPRQAKSIVFTARDLGSTYPPLVLGTCGISEEGLTEQHMLYLSALDILGKVAGVDIITTYLRLPKEMILDLERLLVRKQYVEYSAKGRVLTVEGYKIVKKYEEEK